MSISDATKERLINAVSQLLVSLIPLVAVITTVIATYYKLDDRVKKSENLIQQTVQENAAETQTQVKAAAAEVANQPPELMARQVEEAAAEIGP